MLLSSTSIWMVRKVIIQAAVLLRQHFLGNHDNGLHIQSKCIAMLWEYPCSSNISLFRDLVVPKDSRDVLPSN